MQYTDNFNLNKPEGSDVYDIANENENMDTIDEALAKAFSTDDAASTELANADYIPFFDASASTKKKTLWSTIVSKLKNMFSLGSNLAPIANGPKYPASWYIGKKFVYQGQLCKTTANVTTSDDISVGPSGNAQLDSDITSQIRDLSDKAYQTDDATGYGILQGADCIIPYFNVTSNRKEKIGYSSLKGDLIGRPVANGVIERIGETAMESYAKGDYFLANDFYYYVATSAITANSSTISTGVSGNCSKTSIAAGMNNLTSQISNLGTHYYTNKYVDKLEDSISVTVPAGKYLVIFSGKSQSSEKWIYTKIDNAASSTMEYFGTRTPVNGSAYILDYSRTIVKEYNSQHTIVLSCSTDWYLISLTAVRIH